MGLSPILHRRDLLFLPVAQWQSSRLISERSKVRFLLGGFACVAEMVDAANSKFVTVKFIGSSPITSILIWPPLKVAKFKGGQI